MSGGVMDLLTAEERIALQDPFGMAGASAPRSTVSVRPAAFRSVGHLDPEQITTLQKSVQAVVEQIAKDLSRQLRVPCTPDTPMPQIVAPRLLPPEGDEPFWIELRNCAGHQLLLSLPRVFAAAVTERVFGAPFMLREDRELAAGELTLLKDFVRGWFAVMAKVWPAYEFRMLPAQDPGKPREVHLADWLMFTVPLECGPVQGAMSLAVSPATARLLLGENSGAGSAPVSRASVIRRVGEVPVELRAVLGRAEFSMDELASLNVGDVIALNRQANDPVEITIDDRPCYKARAGLAGQKVALELLTELKESAE
jgi:flagellar motor switch/type III secretory pathway protein FliN